jgi:hypothetical protein
MVAQHSGRAGRSQSQRFQQSLTEALLLARPTLAGAAQGEAATAVGGLRALRRRGEEKARGGFARVGRRRPRDAVVSARHGGQRFGQLGRRVDAGGGRFALESQRSL